MNKKAYNNVIKRCCAAVREEIKREENIYKRLVPRLDKIVATNTSIKVEDIQQEQWDARQRLWEEVFMKYNKELKTLLNILNKQIKKDDNPT